MTDMTPMDDPVAASPEGQPPAPKSGGFLSTTAGKLVIGGVALIAVLVLLGVVGTVFFVFFATPSSNTTTVVKSTTVVKTGSKTATMTPTNPPEAPLSATFTFRNIFAPTVKNPAATTSSSSSSSSTSSTAIPSLPPDTLLLESIQTVDGVKQATFVWNGARYTVTAGQQVDDSPWKVLSIGSTSCVMLYGDQKVTLSVGQAAGK